MATAEAQRERDLKRRYGLTVQEYEALLAAQHNVCGICGKPPKGRRLSVDHRHRSPQLIRGALCGYCNRQILGIAHDNAKVLRAAAEYLEHPPADLVFPEGRLVPATARRKAK